MPPADSDTALRIVEIVGLLLPLTALFLEVLVSNSEGGELDRQTAGSVLFAGQMLFLAGAVGILVTMVSGVNLFVGVALFLLFGGLTGLSMAMVSVWVEITDVVPVPADQQELGSTNTDVETETTSEESDS